MKPNTQLDCARCPAFHQSVFIQLPKEAEEKLSKIRQSFTCESGEEVHMRQGGETGFYCLRSGHWRVNATESAHEPAVRVAGPGELVGYGHWFNPDRPPAARSLGKSEACFFPTNAFLQVQNENPELGSHIIRILCRIIYEEQQRIVGLENCSVKSRVASVLLELNEHFGVPTETGSKIGLIIDRRTIAEMASTVPETLARAITEMEQDRILARKVREIYILNEAKLRGLTLKTSGLPRKGSAPTNQN